MQAQTQALVCQGVPGTPTTIRAEGEAELVADYVLKCSGGFPADGESQVPAYSLTLTLNSSITSRLLAPGWSEALLIVDEPSERQQRACDTPSGVCTIGGT